MQSTFLVTSGEHRLVPVYKTYTLNSSEKEGTFTMTRVKIIKVDFTLLTGHVSSTSLKIYLLQQSCKLNCPTLCTGVQTATKNILATQVFNFIIPRLHEKISALNI